LQVYQFADLHWNVNCSENMAIKSYNNTGEAKLQFFFFLPLQIHIIWQNGFEKSQQKVKNEINYYPIYCVLNQGCGPLCQDQEPRQEKPVGEKIENEKAYEQLRLYCWYLNYQHSPSAVEKVGDF